MCIVQVHNDDFVMVLRTDGRIVALSDEVEHHLGKTMVTNPPTPHRHEIRFLSSDHSILNVSISFNVSMKPTELNYKTFSRARMIYHNKSIDSSVPFVCRKVNVRQEFEKTSRQIKIENLLLYPTLSSRRYLWLDIFTPAMMPHHHPMNSYSSLVVKLLSLNQPMVQVHHRQRWEVVIVSTMIIRDPS